MTRLTTTKSCIAGIAALMTAGLLLGTGAPSAAAEMRPYEAVYRTRLNGFGVDIKRSLEIDQSQLRLFISGKRLFFKLKERAELAVDEDGDLLPLRYEHKRSGVSKKHNKELEFDWNENRVEDRLKPDRAPLAVHRPTYDKLTYQTQLRADLLQNPDLERVDYCVTNGVRNRIYTLTRLGEEILDTPVGRLRTQKWQQTGDDDERQVFVWLAQDWDFLLVRIDQTRKPGGKTNRFTLKRAAIDGERVTGIGD